MLAPDVAVVMVTVSGPAYVPVTGEITGVAAMPGLVMVRNAAVTPLLFIPVKAAIARMVVLLITWIGPVYSFVNEVPTTGLLPDVV